MSEQLIERIRNKDQLAMNQLYREYIGLLSSVCYRYVPMEDDVKDILQNSFIKIFTSISALEYRGEDAFRNWMVRVVVNEALLFLKNRKKLQYTDVGTATLQQIADEGEPEIERLSSAELHQLISELPDGYRTVVNLYVFEGYSHKEIAKLLNKSENTVSSLLQRGRKKLKTILEKEGYV